MNELERNFHFLLTEVERQVEDAITLLSHPNPRGVEKVEANDDYVDNLKSVIENITFASIHGDKTLSELELAGLRAMNIVASNLERVADHAVNIARQTRYLSDVKTLKGFPYRPLVDEITNALKLCEGAVLGRDMAKALRICRSELNLDKLYKSEFDNILRKLRTGVNPADLLTTIFIFRYLERMGDALLNVGEAAIFAITGDKFKIHQFTALNDVLKASGQQNPISDVEFESIWGTRSGCRIGRVHDLAQDENGFREVIFKDGDTGKLKEEAENIARWESLVPGLPPRLAAFKEGAKSSSMLVEALSGETIQDIALSAGPEYLALALQNLCATTGDIWTRTRKQAPVKAGYMSQLRSRLDKVIKIHPGFACEARRIGEARFACLSELILAAEKKEAAIAAPYSVFIHGDFNINNIIYDKTKGRLHYIDLHRSADSDLVQDVSVFMISNFRLPIFDASRRKILNQIIRVFFEFAGQYARDNSDATFEARLCLGLARSFITSTRFELSERFAKLMYLRGTYLLEKFCSYDGAPEAFKLPLAAALY